MQGGSSIVDDFIPSNGIIVDGDDWIRIRAWGTAGNIPVTFYGRAIRPNGETASFLRTLDTDASGTVDEEIFYAGTGVLLSIAASTEPGAITSGAIRVWAELGNGGTSNFVPHTLLLDGALTGAGIVGGIGQGSGVQVPVGSYFEISTTGSTSTLTASYTLPASATRARLVYAQCHWERGATAGNRAVTFELDIGGARVYADSMTEYTVAGTEGYINVTVGGTTYTQTGTIPNDNWTATLGIEGSLWGFGTIDARFYFPSPVTGAVVDSVIMTVEVQ